MRLEATQKLLKRLAQQTGVDPLWSKRQRPGQEPERLIVVIPGILETTKEDGDPRPYATTDLVVVYARYLAPECYEWARAFLAEGTALVEQWSAQQSQAELQSRRKGFTRRAVIAAGWSIPVVTALALNQRAAAQISPGQAGTGGTGTGTTGTGGTGTGGTGTGTTGNYIMQSGETVHEAIPEQLWLLQAVKYEVVMGLVRARPDLLWFHAGAVAFDTGAVVFAAPGGGGKSTLVAWLCQQGWRYIKSG